VWPLLIARDAYRGLFKVQRLPASNFPPRYNVAPTDQIPIVRVDSRDGKREVVMTRWGLIPFWMKEKPKVPHINARAETVEKQPLFRERLPRDDVSSRRLVSLNGKSAKTGSSLIASFARTSNLSPSQACGNSLASVARKSCRRQ
jgi:SOS response associated peptidase (SRAP)